MKSVLQIPVLLPPWQVVQPAVVRYLESKYVEEFILHGRLRVSTCARFSKHDDEQREDQHEGTARTTATFAGSRLDGLLSLASDAVVLSSCCVEDMSEGACFHSGYDAAFRINDPIQFATEIAKALPGYRGGFQGFCIYRDSKHINVTDIAKELGVGSAPPQSADEAARFFDQFNAALSFRVTCDALLRKPLKYRGQNEYRFVWFTEASKGEEFIDIVAPQAALFCERVTPSVPGMDLTSNVFGGVEFTMMSEKEAKAFIHAESAKSGS